MKANMRLRMSLGYRGFLEPRLSRLFGLFGLVG
jgi:hypothetical protein